MPSRAFFEDLVKTLVLVNSRDGSKFWRKSGQNRDFGQIPKNVSFLRTWRVKIKHGSEAGSGPGAFDF